MVAIAPDNTRLNIISNNYLLSNNSHKFNRSKKTIYIKQINNRVTWTRINHYYLEHQSSNIVSQLKNTTLLTTMTQVIKVAERIRAKTLLTCVYIYICVCVCVCIYICVCMYNYTYIYICTISKRYINWLCYV